MSGLAHRCSPLALLLLALAFSASAQATVVIAPSVERAFERLYNFDFPAAHAALDAYQAEQPEDPLGFAVRGAVYLFYELDRLGILRTEFFRDDEQISGKRRLELDPEIRRQFLAVLDRADTLAGLRLERDSQDTTALFALCLKEGLVTDYKVLVEKRGLSSFRNARAANHHAQKLLEIEPLFHDAHLAAGVNEYLLGSLPFFIRWFVRIDGIEGSKEQAFEKLEIVAAQGRYLGPFARILMSIIALREKQPERAQALLDELTRDYPENRLLRAELERVSESLATAKR